VESLAPGIAGVMDTNLKESVTMSAVTGIPFDVNFPGIKHMVKWGLVYWSTWDNKPCYKLTDKATSMAFNALHQTPD
jgi:hypothetical protein